MTIPIAGRLNTNGLSFASGLDIDITIDPASTGNNLTIAAGNATYSSGGNLFLVGGVSGGTQTTGAVYISGGVPNAGPVIFDPTGHVTAADGGAGALTGTFSYKISFFTSTPSETRAGATLSTPITVAGRQVSLASIPTGAAGTSGRYIYRASSADGYTSWGRVGTINDNTTTTFVDNTATPGAAPQPFNNMGSYGGGVALGMSGPTTQCGPVGLGVKPVATGEGIQIYTGWKLQWDVDTTLWRYGANQLKTAGDFLLGGKLMVGTTAGAGAATVNGGLHIGGNTDAGANNLIVDGILSVGTSTQTAALNIAASVAGAASINLAVGIAPTSPNAGDIWLAAQGAITARLLGLTQTLVSCGFTQTASATVANAASGSLVTTGVGTITLPSNFLVAGKTIRLTAKGFYSTKAAGAGTLNIIFKLGSTTVVSTGAVTTTDNQANKSWSAEVTVVCRSTGATGSVVGVGQVIYGGSTVPVADMVATAAVTIDTTASQAIDLQAAWSITDTANTITCQVLDIQIVN